MTLNGSASSDPERQPLTYSWSFVSRPAGSTAPLTNPTAVNPTFVPVVAGQYVVGLVVGDGMLNSTNTANVTVTVSAAAPTPVAPAITTQPASQTRTVGQTATFSVTATGTAPLSYQWRKNGTAIAGATASSYTTPATTTADTGALFSVVVTNAVNSVTSSNATLTVSAPGSTSLDYSIVSFTATKEVRLRSRTPVRLRVAVKNVGRLLDHLLRPWLDRWTA